MVVRATQRCFFGGRVRMPGQEFEVPDKTKLPGYLEKVGADRVRPDKPQQEK